MLVKLLVETNVRVTVGRTETVATADSVTVCVVVLGSKVRVSVVVLGSRVRVSVVVIIDVSATVTNSVEVVGTYSVLVEVMILVALT